MIILSYPFGIQSYYLDALVLGWNRVCFHKEMGPPLNKLAERVTLRGAFPVAGPHAGQARRSSTASA